MGVEVGVGFEVRRCSVDDDLLLLVFFLLLDLFADTTHCFARERPGCFPCV